MNKPFMILFLVLVLSFTFSCELRKERAEEPTVDIAAETEAVKEAFLVATSAIKVQDAELFASTMADDVITFQGDKEAILEWFTNRFAQGIHHDNYSLDKIEISASGDFGYVAFSFDYVREKEGKAEVTGRGYNVSVWKKQVDGTWKQVAF
jgi:ketosteroid isomerase-like protein